MSTEKTNEDYEDLQQGIYEDIMQGYGKYISQVVGAGTCVTDGMKAVDKELADLRKNIEEQLKEFWNES